MCNVITTVLYLLHYNIMYVASFTLLLCIVSQLYCVISCSGSGREASEVNAAAGLTLERPGSASDAGAIHRLTISAFKQGNSYALLQKIHKNIYFTRTTGQYNATLPQTPKQVSIFFSSRSRGHILDSRLCLVS